MRRQIIFCLIASLSISGCVANEFEQSFTTEPIQTQEVKQEPIGLQEAFEEKAPPHNSHSLEAWWSFFGDPTLDRIISSSLSLNPQNSEKETLNLLSELIYAYLEYRHNQFQKIWLAEYLRTADLDKEQVKRHDEQQENLTKKEEELKEGLTELTKLLPEFIDEILREPKPLPTGDITPFLASSTALLNANPSTFSTQTMNRLFGLDDTVFSGSGYLWNIIPGTAEKNILRADTQTLKTVKELERDLIAFIHLREQTKILENALKVQERAGVPDPDKHYKAGLGVLRAQHERVRALTKIYLTLGVY